MSDSSEKDGISIGTGLKAAVKVALSNTAHTVIHPIHTAKVLFGIEEERTIPEMIRDEARLDEIRRKEMEQSEEKDQFIEKFSKHARYNDLLVIMKSMEFWNHADFIHAARVLTCPDCMYDGEHHS